MRKAFVYSLLTILAITGCQVNEVETFTPNEEPEVIQDTKVFTATIDDDFSPETRTSLDGEGNVLWKQYDQVSIFAGSTVNEQYQVTDASDGKTAATLNKVGGGGFVAGTELDNNVAFYPYASTAEIAKSGSNYVISEIELPATQNYAAGSFGNGAFPMAAVTSSTEDMNLKFKNILGGLKLQLKGTATIASITITGKNNEKLYGAAEVTVTYGGTPSISLTDADAKTVTLKCGAGVALNTETATPFIIALPPITMTGGFTVLVTDTEGKQMEISTSKSQTITRSSLLRMPVVNYVGSIKPLKFTFTGTGTRGITLGKYGSPAKITLEYKVDDGEWASYTVGNTINLTPGQELSFRAGASGNSSFSQSSSNYYRFYTSGSGSGGIEASGNVMSLLNQEGGLTIPTSYCFSKLFYYFTSLTTAPELPATTLAQNCYCEMFEDCTSLTTAPELPATTLAQDCYFAMFEDCTSLTTAPELPATTLAQQCYSYMFSGCTSLTTTPSILPATTLAYGCYRDMFEGCTRLTTVPELPATTLAQNCYEEMFYGCTRLTAAPELPATTLTDYCYKEMFEGCTSLTAAPELPATALASSCYYRMFYGCTSLTAAPELPAATMKPSCYQHMFYGCTRLTTAPDLPATTLEKYCYASMFEGCTRLTTAPELPAKTMAIYCWHCYEYMFSRCTSLTTAPDLPATTLAEECYRGMFSGCTSLTAAPALPATTLTASCYSYMFKGCTSLTTVPKLPARYLEENCYDHMFYGCSNLSYIKALFTTPPSSSYTSDWVSGVSATGTFVKSSSATWDVTGSSGIPDGWTVETE